MPCQEALSLGQVKIVPENPKVTPVYECWVPVNSLLVFIVVTAALVGQ